MKLELPKVTLEPQDLSHLHSLLGEAYRAHPAGLPDADELVSRAQREGAVYTHYQTLADETSSAAQRIAQIAFEAGVQYAKLNKFQP